MDERELNLLVGLAERFYKEVEQERADFMVETPSAFVTDKNTGFTVIVIKDKERAKSIISLISQLNIK